MNKRFLIWVALMANVVLGIVAASYFEILQMVFLADVTKISVLIFILFVWYSMKVGKSIYHKDNYRADKREFVSELFMMLGLLGTFIGFGLMLNANLGAAVTDPSKIKEVLVGISSGVSTALYTSIVGLIASILLKIQLQMQRLGGK